MLELRCTQIAGEEEDQDETHGDSAVAPAFALLCTCFLCSDTFNKCLSMFTCPHLCILPLVPDIEPNCPRRAIT